MKKLVVLFTLLLCVHATAQDALSIEPDQFARPLSRGNLQINGVQSIKSNSANAFTVGPGGTLNPVLKIDASAASAVTGLSITGAATAGGVTLQALDSGSNTNLSLLPKGTGQVIAGNTGGGDMFLNAGSGNSIFLKTGNTNRLAITAASSTFTYGNSSAVTPRTSFNFANADTGLTAATNAPLADFIGASITRQHATGADPLQTDYRMTGTTDSFAGASTLTDGATLSLALKSCGTNGTCTNESGLYIGTTALSGTVTNGYGLNIFAPTGAGTGNYAAVFQTGNVGIGTPAPASTLQVNGAANVPPVVDSISTATFTPNLATGNNRSITLVHASCPCTLANPTNPVAGQTGIISVAQSATGSDAITTYGTSYVFTNAAAPTLTTTANAVDYFSYYVLDSTHIRMSFLPASGTSFSVSGIISGGTKFTTSGCSVSATTGGATAGTYMSGTTGTCTTVITMNGATGLTAPNGWSCWGNDQTTAADLIGQSASSSTTATLKGTTVSGDVINFGCIGY